MNPTAIARCGCLETVVLTAFVRHDLLTTPTLSRGLRSRLGSNSMPATKPRLLSLHCLLLLTLLLLGACSQLPPVVVVQPLPGQPALPSVSAPSASPTPAATREAGTTALPGSAVQAGPTEVISGDDSIGDPKAPELGNTGYDVQKYTLNLRLDPKANWLDATAQIQAVSTLAGLARFSLDFVGYQIEDVVVNGQSAAYQRKGAKLWVDLPRPLFANEPFVLSVVYHGRPEPLHSRFLPFANLGLIVDPGSGRAYALNEPDGARTWFPANDHPRDKALFEFQIEVPEPLVAVANGQLAAQEDLGDTTRYVYTSDDPMATYLATIAVGDYQVIEDTAPDGTPLHHYVLPETADRAAAVFAVTGEALAWLEELFGPYPFDSYGHVVVKAGGLALETQTMTLWGDSFLNAPPSSLAPIVVHELAHQWFGDSVSPASWAETWLNEGFATYAMMLWQERTDPEHAFDSLAQYEADAGSNSHAPLDDPPPDSLFGRDTYMKGAFVLHMLRQELGDDLFFQTLRRYASQYAGGVATTEDLRRVAETVSGRDLSTFFDQWVHRAGLPALRLGWTATPPLDGQTTVLLRSCQTLTETAQTPYRLNLEVAVQGPSSEVREYLPISEAEQGFALTVPFQPVSLLADPDNDLLAHVELETIPGLTFCSPSHQP